MSHESITCVTILHNKTLIVDKYRRTKTPKINERFCDCDTKWSVTFHPYTNYKSNYGLHIVWIIIKHELLLIYRRLFDF